MFKLLAAQLRLGERAKTIDEGYVLALAEQVETSGLDKAVILAQDAVYDQRGKPDWEQDALLHPERLSVSGGSPLPGTDDPVRLDQPRAGRCDRRTGPLCGKGGQAPEDSSSDSGR